LALLLVFCPLSQYGSFHVANRQYISILVSLVPILLLAGCSMFGDTTQPYGSGGWIPKPPNPDECNTALDVLNWTASIAILGGIVAMVITRGRIWRPIAIGITLVILSYVIGAYSQLVLLPIGISLAGIVIMFGYKIMIKVWRHKI
jgi:hypothetical protein